MDNLISIFFKLDVWTVTLQLYTLLNSTDTKPLQWFKIFYGKYIIHDISISL